MENALQLLRRAIETNVNLLTELAGVLDSNHDRARELLAQLDYNDSDLAVALELLEEIAKRPPTNSHTDTGSDPSSPPESS
jgi:hypothetical protein